jgi:predicted NBD/HSP70 family sugar kinase/DNA-binding MarR family transcriptional regulator
VADEGMGLLSRRTLITFFRKFGSIPKGGYVEQLSLGRADVTRTALLAVLGGHGPMSRAELARQLDVSPATVGQVTRALIQHGLLEERNFGPSTGGRPGRLLALSGSAGRAIGVKVSLDVVTAVEMRLNGEVLRSAVDPFDATSPEALARLAIYLSGFMEEGGQVGQEGAPLLGVGVCVPGVVGRPDAGIADVPSFGWSGAPVGRYLRGALGVPVLVENGVKALAFSELLYGQGRQRSNFAVLTVGRGVGFAVVCNREVQRGVTGAAGEIAHVIVARNGPLCGCGGRGCLESFAGNEGLLRAARSAGVLSEGEGTDRLAELATAGDPAALEVYHRAATVLGEFIAGPVTAFDPELVVIAGEGSSAWRHWSEPFCRSLRRHLPVGWHDVAVVVSSWLDSSWAQGAAAMVLATPLSGRRGVAGRQRSQVLARLHKIRGITS